MTELYFLQHLSAPLSAILLALTCDMLTRIAPVVRDYLPPLFGMPARMAARLEAKLNRTERTVATRRSRGMTSLALMLGLAVVLAAAADHARSLSSLVEPVLWWSLFVVTKPWSVGYELVRLGAKANVAQANDILERRMSDAENATIKDMHGAYRLVIENVAASLSYGMWFPLFYGLIAALCGLPALPIAVAVVVVTEAARITRLRDPKNIFAAPFQLLDTVIGFVPSRVCAVFIALAAFFTPRANPFAALRGMFAQGAWHVNPSLGWPLAAVACALQSAIPSGSAKHPWLGLEKASARADAAHVKTALWLHAVALGLTVLVLIVLLFLSLAV